MNRRHFAIFARLGLALLLGPASASAIEIDIPEQYREEVERLRAEEKKRLQEELEQIESGGGAAAGSAPADAAAEGDGGMRFTGGGGAGDPAPDAEEGGAQTAGSGSFLLESVEEAEGAAETYEKDLPENQGLVSGQVVDRETGTPVSGVAILLEGTDAGTITDADGRYSLGPAPAGQYTLSFVKSGYIEANVTEFEVKAGQVSVFPFALPPRPAQMSDEVYELQDFTVTAQEANDMMMKLDLKFDSSRALDVFSSEDFSKFAASDVADAVKRIAGVSINEGKFPSVRGLNDRYTATTVNGMVVPSPDPFRKSPQFDIFPSSLLESIVVSKSATADLVGESTAANFDLITKQMPEEFFLKVSLGTGFHSGSIDEFRSFDRPDRYLLADAAGRFNQPPFASPLDNSTDPDFERSEQLGSESENAGPNTSVSLSAGNTFEFPNGQKLGVVFAGYHKRETSAILDAENVQGYDFDGADRLVLETITLPPFLGGGTIDVPTQVSTPFGDETTYDYEEFEENVRLGGLLGLSLELNEDHRVFGNLFTSRTADTIVSRNFNGRNTDESISEDDNLFALREQLYYVERSLTLGQVGGEHALPRVDFEPEIAWGLQRARTTQDEPDFRNTFVVHRFSDFPDGQIPQSVSRDNTPRNVNSDDNLPLSSNSWRFVQEDEDAARLDISVKPTKKFELSLGGMATRADRTSDVQSFLENRGDSNPTGTTQAGTGISEGNFENGSRSIRSSSEAIRDIDALYLMSEYEPFGWLRLNFGYRFEDSIMSVDSETILDSSNSLANSFRAYDQARNTPNPSGATLVRATEADVLGVPDGFRNTTGDTVSQELLDRVYLPSVSGTISPLDGVQVKLAYYETINRPSFREITPDIFIDSENNDQLGGNPFLQSSTAESYDFRVEFYPGQFEFSFPLSDSLFHDDDMLGISLFYKEIEDPIEFLRPTDQNIDEIPFNNPEGAETKGVEFEFNKNLGFLRVPLFEHLTLGGNFAFTTAVAGVSDAESQLLGLNNNTDEDQLDGERELTEQPEQIINLNLSFQHPDFGTRVTLAYNEKSEILEAIGSEKDFDAFRGPTERLDLIVSHEFENGLKASFAVKNLLDQGYETYFRNRAPDFSRNNIENLEDPSQFGQDQPRKTVDTIGRSFSFSLSYDF